MKAIIQHAYGSPDLLELREVQTPTAGDDELLVRVHASSVNPADWHQITGVPYLMRLQAGLRRPKQTATGTDYAGTVEAVGKDVTEFKPGDAVFGARTGAFAEYVCVKAAKAVSKPESVTFEEAATVPIAALTALQGLRDKGRIEPGQRVLINGAAGGVGTFAVQLAKVYGAHVTGVCSTRNVDLVRSLGADEVIDYTEQDFTRGAHKYDLILDNVGTRSTGERRRVMQPTGTLVVVSGPKTNNWLGPMTALAKTMVAARFGRQRMVPMLTQLVVEDLATMRDLLAAGKVVPVIEREYPLTDVAEALNYLGTGHAKAKLVVTI